VRATKHNGNQGKPCKLFEGVYVCNTHGMTCEGAMTLIVVIIALSACICLRRIVYVINLKLLQADESFGKGPLMLGL
jgi:hypothetical protein